MKNLLIGLSIFLMFGIGLRFADVATQELLRGNALAEFQSWLTEQNLYMFTLNGFPFGGFHRQVVKDQVYAPDWSKQEQLNYSIIGITLVSRPHLYPLLPVIPIYLR